MIDSPNEEQMENKAAETATEEGAAEQTTANAETTELSETDALKLEVAELKDKYLRLYSDFDNYRKRTSKEKIDLLKTASEELMVALLPVLDDFERAHKAIQPSPETESLIEGINLIYNKLFRTLEGKGLKPMDTAQGVAFNTELHEAITQFPAPSDELKGKIMDTAEKGYHLHEKVIRFAKVIIGA